MIATQEQKSTRQKRHEKLMKLISEYYLTQDEVQQLERAKRNTEIQIATKFKKSKQNQNYVFPLKIEEKSEEIEEFPAKLSFEHTYYDLNNQNYLSNNILTFKRLGSDVARRVKSLGSQKIEDRIQAEISRGLRLRPSERESSRQRIFFPQIAHSKSVKVLSKIQMKPLNSNFSPSKESKSAKKLIKMGQNISKQKNNKVAQMLGAKLLTEGNNILPFNSRPIMLNSLKIMNMKHSSKINKQ